MLVKIESLNVLIFMGEIEGLLIVYLFLKFNFIYILE